MHNLHKSLLVRSIGLCMVFGVVIIFSGCDFSQNKAEDQIDYSQLAEQLKQCDTLLDQSAIENCRSAITDPLSDDEKEKLVDELQAIGYYPQP